VNWLDPFSVQHVDASIGEGFRVVTAFGALFWGLLYVLPAVFVAPYADHDSALAVIEVYRRQWLVHGHTLESSWLFGGGALLRGLAQVPGWSPAVVLSLVVGPKAAALAWAWVQLSLGGGFGYGWARRLGANHRGAAIGALLGWCSLWLVRHMVDGHLAWPALCWVLGLGWLGASRLSTSRAVGAALAVGLLLFSSSPLQAPFYGLPVLLIALWTATPRNRRVLCGALLLAFVPHLPIVMDTFESHLLYARDTTIALQDIKFLHGGSRLLRNLLGLVLPFASYGYHAEGNLLALLPLLWASGRPSRRLMVTVGVILVIGFLPGLVGIRQLERCWWALLLLAGWHLARRESRISLRLVHLSLGFTTAVSAALFAMRALLVAPVQIPPQADGITGIATVMASYLANDEVEGGTYGAIRAGRVVHRPFTHVALSEVPPAGDFVISSPVPVEVREGLLLAGGLEVGDTIVLALRPEAARWLEPVDGIQVGSRHGWLTLTATVGLPQLSLYAR